MDLLAPLFFAATVAVQAPASPAETPSSVSQPAPPPPPAVTQNWNQWDESIASGTAEGLLKLSIGASYVATTVSGTWPLELVGESLVTDRIGLRGQLSLPLSSRADKLWVPSLSIGPTFHFLPRTFLDPFVSLRGGLAWPFENGTAVQLSPFVAASAGVTVYYWGIFFAEVEGGYQLTALSQPTRSVDLGGAFVSLRFGLAL
jgi:hypothetical protein